MTEQQLGSGRTARATLLLATSLIALNGCSAASYMVPGAAANLAIFGLETAEMKESRRTAQTDDHIKKRLAVKPLAEFPLTLAVVRVQAPQYRSYAREGRGSGKYSVVTGLDAERVEDMDRLAALPLVDRVMPVSSLLLPRHLNSDRELREAAAAVQADMVLLYTYDTTFHVANTVEPLGIITLGLFPSKEARVNSTAAALLLDTRNGYVYGVAEATDRQHQIANFWTDERAVEQSRLRAERNAFAELITRVEAEWAEVIERHAPPELARPELKHIQSDAAAGEVR